MTSINQFEAIHYWLPAYRDAIPPVEFLCESAGQTSLLTLDITSVTCSDCLEWVHA